MTPSGTQKLHVVVARSVTTLVVVAWLLLFGGGHTAFSQPFPELKLPTKAEFIKILPGDLSAIVVSRSQRKFAIINLATGETREGSLAHSVFDIALGSPPFIYFVGAKKATAGSDIVSRLDYESGAMVSVEMSARSGIPSVTVDQKGTILLGDSLDRRLFTIPESAFSGESPRKIGEQSSVVASYSTGVGDLGVTPDGGYILAALADGSEMVLLDRETGRISSKYRLTPFGTTGVFASAKSVKVVAGLPSGVNQTTPTVLYGSAGQVASPERNLFFVFVLNEMYRALDLVQVVRVEFGRGLSTGRHFPGSGAADAIEWQPAMIVASDDDQQYMLLGTHDSTRVRWFRRKGQVVSPLGDPVELGVAPVDLDVSRDGRLAVVLHKGRPAVTVLREADLAGLFTFGMSEERNCELWYAQVFLALQGYPVGAADGVYGPATRDALIAFQVNTGLKPTGVLDSATSDKLLKRELRLARELSQQTTPGIPASERAYQLSRLGLALSYLWERNHDEKDLDDRVAAFRSALEELSRNPSEPVVDAFYENNLCFALAEAGDDKKDPALLEEAIAMCRSALEKLSADESPVSWANTQHSLGFGLWKRYEQTGDETMLAEAAEAIRSARNILEENDPNCNRDRVRKDFQSIEALLK